MGIGSFQANPNHLALHVTDVAAARAALEERGVNSRMLHHRYAPRVAD